MARRLFGGTIADYAVKDDGTGGVAFASGGVVKFWNARTGGTQYTDLTDLTGNAITSVTVSGGNDGRPIGWYDQCYGPDQVMAMWAEVDGGPRVLVICADLADSVQSATANLTSLSSQVQDFINGSTTPNTYNDKVWAAVGTSITHMGFYVSELESALGCTAVNLGVSGGTICTGTASDGTSVGNGDTFDKLAEIPSTATLVTLEAGVNDFRASMPLGQMGDSDQSTFYGALYAACTAMKSSNPAADIFLFTPYGFTESTFSGTWRTDNGFGASLADFQKAIHDVGGQFSIPVIAVGEESGIGGPTADYYMSDGLHINAKGGARFSDYAAPRILKGHVNWDYPTGGGPTGPTYGPALNSNTGFETDASAWYATHSSTIAQSTDQSHSGTASLLITPGAETTPGAASWSVAVTAGKQYRLSGWMYSPSGWSQGSVSANWLDDSDVYVSGADKGYTTLPAGTWRLLDHTFTADAACTRAAVTVSLGGAPSATDTVYVDDVQIQEVLTGA